MVGAGGGLPVPPYTADEEVRADYQDEDDGNASCGYGRDGDCQSNVRPTGMGTRGIGGPWTAHVLGERSSKIMLGATSVGAPGAGR